MPQTYIPGLVLGLVIGYLVYTDAKKRKNVNAAVWGIVGFLFGLIGALVYYLAVVRKDSPKN